MTNFYTIPGENILVEDPTSFWGDYLIAPPTRIFTSFYDFENSLADDTIRLETQVGVPTYTTSNQENGWLEVTNSAADNDDVLVQFGAGPSAVYIKPNAGRTIWFEAAVKLPDTIQTDFFIGLASSTAALPFNPTDSLSFIKSDGAATVNFASIASSVNTIVSAVTSMSNSVAITFGIKVINTDKVEYWIDHNKIGELTTNITTAKMRPFFLLRNGEANAKRVFLDYLHVSQTRQQEGI